MGKIQKNNIKQLSYQEMCDYLSFLDKTIFDLVERRKVYLDVHAALIEQRAKMNNFIYWIMNNYYQVLILTLCRILEAKTYDSERKTLRHFINSLKHESNYQIIKQQINVAQIDYHYDNGDIEYEDISENMLKILNSIDFDRDITDIEIMHNKLKNIRDKQIAHLTNVDETMLNRPEIIEMHQYIDKIIEKLKKYHVLFRHGIDYGENVKNTYVNFKFELK